MVLNEVMFGYNGNKMWIEIFLKVFSFKVIDYMFMVFRNVSFFFYNNVIVIVDN